MKKLIVWVFVGSWFFCLGLSAQQSLLWKIERNDLAKPAYLFGTIHLICEAEYQMPEKVKGNLKQAEVLVLEANPKQANAMKVLKRTLAPKDSVLSKLLPDSTYLELDKYFKMLNGSSISRYQRFKPFFISSWASLYYFNCEPKQLISLEKELIKHKPKKCKIFELEGFEQQMNFIDQIDLKKQAEMLVDFAGNHKNNYAEMQNLFSAYLAEDLEQIDSISKKEVSIESSADIQNLFLENRNKNWIPVIEQIIKEKSAFIAVGAAHLVGKEGLIALLRNKGYALTAVTE